MVKVWNIDTAALSDLFLSIITVSVADIDGILWDLGARIKLI